MIKQSILNRFDKKYVKASVGDLWEFEGIKAPEGTNKLTADDKLFERLTKLFQSSLNENEPGMMYGALRTLGREPFKFEPLLKLMRTMKTAKDKFLEGQTDMTPYFMEMKRIFDEDVKIESPEGRDTFIKWFLETATAQGSTMTGANNRPMAQALWNKLLLLYTSFIRLTIQGLGGDTKGMSTRPDQSRSWKAGTLPNQISELFVALGTPFKDYVSDFGRDYVIQFLDSHGEHLTDFITKAARKYSNVAQYNHSGVFESSKNVSGKVDFLSELQKLPLFKQVKDLLEGELLSYNIALEASKIETKERNKGKEKLPSEGFQTDGHDEMFWGYLRHDMDLKYIILTELGLSESASVKNRDSVVVFLKALKEADSALFAKFSTGCRSAIKAPEGTDPSERDAVVAKQVADWKTDPVYEASIDAAKSQISRSRARKPDVDLTGELDSKDSQRTEQLEKLDRLTAKRKEVQTKLRGLSNPDSIAKVEAILKTLDEAIDKTKTRAASFGAKL